MKTIPDEKKTKTVLVLGAGFSYGSGIPVQNNLLQNIVNYYNISGTVEQKANWNSFLQFFEKNICRDIKKFKIEDIFTIFDKSLLDEESFRGKSADDIKIANINLLKSLKNYIANIGEQNFTKKSHNYSKYNELAKILITKRTAYGSEDKMSIICLNWDDYFERVLTYIQRSTKDWQNTLLDYCTYEYSFSNSGKSIPSILKKAKGKINFKVLKPHGSVNWGYCPNCGRLYISLGSKIKRKFECIKYCNKKYGKVDLNPVLLTPTFLKDLSNSHIKNIWQNVGIELDEATSVIFVGYSLRPEDFYFRYQLLKYIDKNTKIYVFDYTKESDPKKQTTYKNRIKKKYESFFQLDLPIDVYIDGWENNIAAIEKIIE